MNQIDIITSGVLAVVSPEGYDAEEWSQVREAVAAGIAAGTNEGDVKDRIRTKEHNLLVVENRALRAENESLRGQLVAADARLETMRASWINGGT